jgi:hypothetical protein
VQARGTAREHGCAGTVLQGSAAKWDSDFGAFPLLIG